MPPRRRNALGLLQLHFVTKEDDRMSIKHKQWTNESMEAAMDTVRKGPISIHKAALLHGVPSTTL